MSVRDAKGEWAPKWVHLLDGGLTDNIGLRSILARTIDRAASSASASTPGPTRRRS